MSQHDIQLDKNKKTRLSNIFIKFRLLTFGPPKQFLSDNTGEFSNELLREVNGKLTT